MFRIYVSKAGEVIELDRRQMLGLIQGDAEIGEIIVRAFILRRAGLVASGIGDTVLLGSAHSADTLRLKEFLMRNAHPYAYVDLERDADVEQRAGQRLALRDRHREVRRAVLDLERRRTGVHVCHRRRGAREPGLRADPPADEPPLRGGRRVVFHRPVDHRRQRDQVSGPIPVDHRRDAARFGFAGGALKGSVWPVRGQAKQRGQVPARRGSPGHDP